MGCIFDPAIFDPDIFDVCVPATGEIAQGLPALGQSASGTLTASGPISQTLPALVQSATGAPAPRRPVATPGPIFGPVFIAIRQELPALTQHLEVHVNDDALVLLLIGGGPRVP
jgi:hypothetical protein